MSSFRLQSGDSGFNSRVDALFSSLQTAAVDLEPQLKRSHDEISDGDGERGEFRRPQGTGLSWRGRGRGPRNNTPDYVKNPQKWTRYNMKDTKVLSNRENNQVGLELFDELRTRRLQEVGREDGEADIGGEVGCPKIVFKKPTAPPDVVEDDARPKNFAGEIFGGAKKIRLQEYEVGKPNRKRSARKTTAGPGKIEKESSDKQVKLPHLMYEEEDD